MTLLPSKKRLLKASHIRKLLYEKYYTAGCRLCPRECRVLRSLGETGFCGMLTMGLHSYLPHYGEEPPLSGSQGSGTIFFTGCSLKCCYCQNHLFSMQDRSISSGTALSPEGLAAIMIKLQALGCHNISLVTPTHSLPFIIDGLMLAWGKGLSIPIVYNTSGYEKPEIIALLDGLIDIYMPDYKYALPAYGEKYSHAPDYPGQACASLQEMYRQRGPLAVDDSGTAVSGVLVRHLILPSAVENSIEVLKSIRKNISPDIPISLMSQYHPEYRASDYPEISRMIRPEEYDRVLDVFTELGFTDGFIQKRPLERDRARFLGSNLRVNRGGEPPYPS